MKLVGRLGRAHPLLYFHAGMDGRRCSAAVASCCLLALALLAPQATAADGWAQAPQPAMTRTNIAQQVQVLANVPALYNNVPAPAPVTLPAASAVNQFQSTSGAQASTQQGHREEVRYQWAPQAAPQAQATSQQQTGATTQAAAQPAQRPGPGQLPPLPQQMNSGRGAFFLILQSMPLRRLQQSRCEGSLPWM